MVTKCLMGVLFEKSGLNNTDAVFENVKDYLGGNNVNNIIIASTTGFTASFAERYFVDNEKLIICKQDMSDEFSMKKEVQDKLEEKYTVVDIPLKYLRNKIGADGTNILRRISQGVKVCFELVEFLCEKEMLSENGKVVAIAGTLKGADTAVAFQLNGKHNYKVDRILCLPRNI